VRVRRGWRERMSEARRGGSVDAGLVDVDAAAALAQGHRL